MKNELSIEIITKSLGLTDSQFASLPIGYQDMYIYSFYRRMLKDNTKKDLSSQDMKKVLEKIIAREQEKCEEIKRLIKR